MNAANADESIINVSEEAEWGVINTDPVWLQARSSGDGLSPEINKSVSEELNPNADVTGVFPTSGGASGDYNFELAFGPFFDLLLEHAFRGSFDGFGILKAGTAYKSMSIEKQLLVNGVPFYKRYPGLRVNTFALELNRDTDAAISGTVNLMGKEEQTSDSIVTGATYVTLPLTQVFYMPEVRLFKIEGDGISGDYCFRQFGFSINNNVRSQQGVCTQVTSYPDLTAKGTAYGRREVTLDLAAYFRDLELNDIFTSNDTFSVSYVLSNGTSGYKLTFSKTYLMSNETPIEGTNSDVMENMTGQAILDDTTGTSVIAERIINLAAGKAMKLTDTTVLPDVLSPAVAGAYYDDGTIVNTKARWIRADGKQAAWWSSIDSVWYTTPIADVGTEPTDNAFSNNQAASPVGGTWIAVGGSTVGSVESAAYNPLV